MLICFSFSSSLLESFCMLFIPLIAESYFIMSRVMSRVNTFLSRDIFQIERGLIILKIKHFWIFIRAFEAIVDDGVGVFEGTSRTSAASLQNISFVVAEKTFSTSSLSF